MESGEMQNLIVNKSYTGESNNARTGVFSIRPCVGGMVSGVQTKWRVFRDQEGDEGMVVMNDVPFDVLNGILFVIEHSKEKGYTIKHTSL